jgi:putative tryptophan/tyrosine transport system substrate-binding protein
MRRRQFLSVVGGAAVWPVATHAQQAERTRRSGILMGYALVDREGQAFVASFREGLQKLGWIESHNIQIDARWGAGNAEPTEQFANELVALKPDLIL